MIKALLIKSFYGNTITQWIIAFSIITGALILGKCLYWLIGKTLKKLTRKTKTRIDDILVDMLEEPFVLAVIIAGTWHGIKFLDLTDAAAATIDKAFQGLIIVNAAWLLIRLFDALVEEYLIPFVEQTESDLDDQLVPVIRKSIKLSVWVIAIIMALDNAGYEVFSILAGLGIGGLAFALAAQETVGNFFGSIAIFTDKPFKVGDRIQARGHDGVVIAVGLRSTRIKSRYQGRTITIPNSQVARADIVNVDTEHGRQVFSVYRLTPDMDDKQIAAAMDVLKHIAKSDPETQEKVVTGFFAITEYSRDIMLLYWVNPGSSNLKTRTRINLEIIRQFNENKIQLVKANPIHAKMDQVELL
jgi:MscS family membrane protein